MTSYVLRTGLSFLFLFSFVACQAQRELENLSTENGRAERKFRRAYDHFKEKENQKAIDDLEKAIELDPDFIEAHVLLASVHLEDQAFDAAIPHYKKAIAIDPRYDPQLSYDLGKLYFQQGQYEEAVPYLEDFLTIPSRRKEIDHKAEHYLRSARFAMHAVKNPVPFDPQNLGPAINSKHDEYLPAITADEQTLIITRRGPSDKKTRGRGNYREEDFYVSHKKNGEWTEAENLGPPINTPGNEGAQCISPDGQYLFFTACDRPDGFGSCDLYYSRRVGEKWSPPRNMGEKVNSRGWDSQPSISADGRTLYFSSSRKGSSGKTDIWKTTLDHEGGWSEPVNVSSLNTSFNDRSPFMHPDGRTLYFSSNGHPGMGGMDIFVARKKKDGEGFHKIRNLGYPINGTGDESSLIVSTDGKTAYFASEDREDVIGQIDLYSFELYEEVRADKVTYTKGVVYDKESGKRLQARCELIDLETEETVVEVYSNPGNGSFLVCLPPGRDYALNVARPGYLFFSKNFSLKDTLQTTEPYKMDVPLTPIQEGASVVLNNVFFETAKYDLKESSRAELMKLVSFLEQNPDLRIRLEGHTDSIGTEQDNQVLSENRARSVYEFLVENGISKDRLTYKGYGEERPIATNETPEGRSKNRRTAFTILGDQEKEEGSGTPDQ